MEHAPTGAPVSDPKRWKNRTVHELSDLLGSFDSRSDADLLHNAGAAISALRAQGREFWDEDSDEFRKWRDSCTDLSTFLDTLSLRRARRQGLESVLREFYCVFEHSEMRIRQLLFQATENEADDGTREGVVPWLQFIFRAGAYAITAAWIDHKHEETVVRIHMNLTTGASKQDVTRKRMPGPSRKERQRRHPSGGIPMTNTESRLVELAIEHLGISPELDRAFSVSGVNSVDAAGFLKVIAQEFNLSLSAGDCEGIDTLRGIAGLVDARGGRTRMIADFSQKTPEAILEEAAAIDDAESRVRRRNALNALRNRTSAWISAFDARGDWGGPSLDEAERVVEDLKTRLSAILR